MPRPILLSLTVGALALAAIPGASAAASSPAGEPTATVTQARTCGTVFSSGFRLRVLATRTTCARGRSVARRYDIVRDRQRILGYDCRFVRRGLARCTRGSARLRFDLRAVE